MRYLICLSVVLMTAHAFAASGLTFYMSFDRWMLPDFARGARAPIKIVGAPRLTPGKFGKALTLDGNSYLEFPAGDNVAKTGGTVACWFKPDNWGEKTYDNLFGFSEGVNNALHFERVHPGGQFRLTFGGPNVKTPPLERSLFSQAPLNNGEWVHLAAAWDMARQRAEMFINGQSVAVLDQPGPLPMDPPSLLIGCGFGRLARSVRGQIDELAILDHAATAEEVVQLMQGSQAGGALAQLSNDALNVVVDQDHGYVTIGSGGDAVPQMVLGPATVSAQIGDALTVPQRFEQAEPAAPIAPRLGAAQHRVFTTRDEASGAEVRLHVQMQQTLPLALLWLEVRNPTDRPLVVSQLNVLRTAHPGAVVFAAPAERLRIFLDNGSLCGSGSKAFAAKGADHAAHGAFVVTDPEGDWAGSCSFVTFQTGTVTSHITTGPDGMPQLLEARCDYPNGYRVAPGQALASEVLAVGSYGPMAATLESRAPAATAAGWKARSPSAGHAALDAWADAVMAVNDLQPPRFCMSGWNSWYCYRLTITEDLVLQNAQVIRDKLPGLGLENMQIDHGWQYKDIVGNWVVNDRFPHGLPWLTGKLREMGCTLGLWTGVTNVSEFAPLFREHPEAMFQNADGTPQVGGDYWYWEPHGKTYNLDPTHPLGEEFYRKVGEAIRDSGCVYWKNDFQANLTRTDGVLHDRDLTRGTPVYLKAVRTYRDGAGPKVAHMACNAALNPIAGLCDAAWVHGDIGNPSGNWQWLRGFWRDFNCRAHVSGKFYWADPDYLQVGQGTPNENRVRMAFAVFGGGPMFLSDRMPELPDDKIELIKQCLPAVGPTATPLDMFTYREYPQVSHLPVKTDWGSWHMLGLFNLDERADKVTVNLADLGLELDREYVIWDYFPRRLVGHVRALRGAELLLRMPLPVADVSVLRVTPVQPHPFVVGTDLHLAQGAVELHKVRWDEKTLTLAGEVTRPPGTQGHVFVAAPAGYAPKQGTLGADRVLAMPVRCTAATTKWSAAFTRSAHP